MLAQKLKALEEKLLHGSNAVNEKLSEKVKELAIREQQIRDQEFLDEERRRKIAELEVNKLPSPLRPVPIPIPSRISAGAT